MDIHKFLEINLHKALWSDRPAVIVTCCVLDTHRHLWPEVAVLPVTLGRVSCGSVKCH